jgi:hypothetical protein
VLDIVPIPLSGEFAGIVTGSWFGLTLTLLIPFALAFALGLLGVFLVQQFEVVLHDQRLLTKTLGVLAADAGRIAVARIELQRLLEGEHGLIGFLRHDEENGALLVGERRILQ